MFFVLAGGWKPRREFWFLDPHYLLPFFWFLFLWGLNWRRGEATGPLWLCQPRWLADLAPLSCYHIWIYNKLLKIMFQNKKWRNINCINWHGVAFMGTLLQIPGYSIKVWQKQKNKKNNVYILKLHFGKSPIFLETQ